jgi:hypothetical protein
MVVVRRRRILRLVVSLVLMLGVRTVVAAPMQDGAELRAIIHCTQHMGRPVTVPESRHCCQVSSDADAPATLAAAPASPDTGVVAVLAPLPVVFERPWLDSSGQLDRRGERDGPPLYLALQSIRC